MKTDNQLINLIKQNRSKILFLLFLWYLSAGMFYLFFILINGADIEVLYSNFVVIAIWPMAIVGIPSYSEVYGNSAGLVMFLRFIVAIFLAILTSITTGVIMIIHSKINHNSKHKQKQLN